MIIKIRGIEREVDGVYWDPMGTAHIYLRPVNKWDVIKQRIWRCFGAVHKEAEEQDQEYMY